MFTYCDEDVGMFDISQVPPDCDEESAVDGEYELDL